MSPRGPTTSTSHRPVDIVTRLGQGPDVPLRSHGSLSLNRTLLTYGQLEPPTNPSRDSRLVGTGPLR